MLKVDTLVQHELELMDAFTKYGDDMVKLSGKLDTVVMIQSRAAAAQDKLTERLTIDEISNMQLHIAQTQFTGQLVYDARIFNDCLSVHVCLKLCALHLL
jgi:hypothetical protein